MSHPIRVPRPRLPLVRLVGLLVLPAILAPASPRADTWVVEPDGTGDLPTIQAAVDFAAAGDEILLTDGEFAGAGNRDIRFAGKELTIRSASGRAEAVVIQCEGRAGFRYVSGEGSGALLAQISIVGSSNALSGLRGAVACRNGASPTIRDVIVRNFHVVGVELMSSSAPTFEGVTFREGVSASILSFDSSPVITDCLFEANTAVGSATHQITLVRSDALIENCTIRGNGPWQVWWSAGAIYMKDSSPTIRGCVITGNQGSEGAGLKVVQSSPVLERCTLTGNRAEAGAALWIGSSSLVTVEHSILWGNCATDFGSAAWLDPLAVLDLRCSTVFLDGIAGPGNAVVDANILSDDPLFCDPLVCDDGGFLPSAEGVFTLGDTSPALGQPCGTMGALEAGCVISIEQLSWGAIKSRYR